LVTAEELAAGFTTSLEEQSAPGSNVFVQIWGHKEKRFNTKKVKNPQRSATFLRAPYSSGTRNLKAPQMQSQLLKQAANFACAIHTA